MASTAALTRKSTFLGLAGVIRGGSGGLGRLRLGLGRWLEERLGTGAAA